VAAAGWGESPQACPRPQCNDGDVRPVPEDKCCEDVCSHGMFQRQCHGCSCPPNTDHVEDDTTCCGQCLPMCGLNEVRKICGTACEATCAESNPVCTKQCVLNQCECAKGFIRQSAEGPCIAKSECPVCGGENEVLKGCGTACEATCAEPSPLCTKECITNQCECAKGSIRQSAGGPCIAKSECPQRCSGTTCRECLEEKGCAFTTGECMEGCLVADAPCWEGAAEEKCEAFDRSQEDARTCSVDALQTDCNSCSATAISGDRFCQFVGHACVAAAGWHESKQACCEPGVMRKNPDDACCDEQCNDGGVFQTALCKACKCAPGTVDEDDGICCNCVPVPRR